MTDIRIYQGNQIGSCITVISCGETKIVIDFGESLPGAEIVENIEIQDFDIVLILTDEAINYYKLNESEIDKHIKNIKNLCEIYEWNLTCILKHYGKLKV